jgi:acetyl esterase/lipase
MNLVWRSLTHTPFRSYDRNHHARQRRSIPRRTLRHDNQTFQSLHSQHFPRRQNRLYKTWVIPSPQLASLVSTLLTPSPSYACPQTFPTRQNSGGPISDEHDPPLSSELDCLILQLAIPLSHLKSLSSTSPSLPVMLYIHGGGFVLGQIDEHHSTALLTDQSVLDAQPLITASIQYRLGALGYLHVPEAKGANVALHDQRNALLWIQRFIGGFGGNKSDVTLFGESGGSISICSQMLFPKPETGALFRRVILMSGLLGPMMVPRSREYTNKVYEGFLERMGVEERGTEGLERLREMDVQRLVDATREFANDGGLFRPVLDAEWFGMEEEEASVVWDRMPELVGRCEWVEEIVLGTTSFEVSLKELLLRRGCEADMYVA